MRLILVMERARPCSSLACSGSRSGQVVRKVMANHKVHKVLEKEEPTSSGTNVSSANEHSAKKTSVSDHQGNEKMTAAKEKSSMSRSTTRKRRAPLVNAATAPAPIDVEEDVACIKRKLPPVDAARSPSEAGDNAPNPCESVQSVSDSDDLADVVDAPEVTLEDELLREVGLQTQESKEGK